MSVAFRYSGLKYNDALLALGAVRIGTLHDFRKTEHKKGIADANEGKKNVKHFIPYVTEKDDGSINSRALRDFSGIKIDEASNIVFSNTHLIEEFDFPDCFVHCTSICYSRDVLAQFEGADSCVEITNLAAFYIRLTATLNSLVPVQFLTMSKVLYMQRSSDWSGQSWGEHPALIKEPEFSKQMELRVIWRPKFKGPISPIVMNDIGLIDFCKSKELP